MERSSDRRRNRRSTTRWDENKDVEPYVVEYREDFLERAREWASRRPDVDDSVRLELEAAGTHLVELMHVDPDGGAERIARILIAATEFE